MTTAPFNFPINFNLESDFYMVCKKEMTDLFLLKCKRNLLRTKFSNAYDVLSTYKWDRLEQQYRRNV